jgi:hypothetical protein
VLDAAGARKTIGRQHKMVGAPMPIVVKQNAAGDVVSVEIDGQQLTEKSGMFLATSEQLGHYDVKTLPERVRFDVRSEYGEVVILRRQAGLRIAFRAFFPHESIGDPCAALSTAMVQALSALTAISLYDSGCLDVSIAARSGYAESAQVLLDVLKVAEAFEFVGRYWRERWARGDFRSAASDC